MVFGGLLTRGVAWAATRTLRAFPSQRFTRICIATVLYVWEMQGYNVTFATSFGGAEAGDKFRPGGGMNEDLRAHGDRRVALSGMT